MCMQLTILLSLSFLFSRNSTLYMQFQPCLITLSLSHTYAHIRLVLICTVVCRQFMPSLVVISEPFSSRRFLPELIADFYLFIAHIISSTAIHKLTRISSNDTTIVDATQLKDFFCSCSCYRDAVPISCLSGSKDQQ